MDITQSSPVLTSKTRTGKDKMWQVHVCTDAGCWYTRTSYWQRKGNGEESLIQWSEPYQVHGKNIGRSNETTPEDQATLEFQRAIQKQKDKGYLEDGEEATVLPLPMLAHKYVERGHQVVWPAYVQPKLNGQRMLFDGENGWSRGGKIILSDVISHIKDALGEIPPGTIFDGELMLPDNQLLQESMKAIKKYRPGVSETLQYWIYDIVDSELSFKERFEKLLKIRGPVDWESPLILTPTYLVDEHSALSDTHSLFVEQGFEGTMIRSGVNGYDIGHSNVQLQKMKDFVDGEFLILDVIEGDGRFKGAAIFVCDNGFGETFNPTPEGSMEVRREYYENRNELRGKWLTVRYQELSKDKIPIFPIGITIRDSETGGF